MRTALAQLILHIAGVHLDANGVPREIPTEAAPDVGLLGTRTALIAHLFPVVDEGVRDEYGGWGRSGVGGRTSELQQQQLLFHKIVLAAATATFCANAEATNPGGATTSL